MKKIAVDHNAVDKGLSTVQRWYQIFHRGHFDLQDKGGSGSPSDVDVDQLKVIVEIAPTKTFREIVNELNG